MNPPQPLCSSDRAAAVALCASAALRAPATAAPPPCYRQRRGVVLRHRRSLRAAAIALPPSCCAPPPRFREKNVTPHQSTERAVSGKVFFLTNIIQLTFIYHHRFPARIQTRDSLTRCIPGIWQDHIPFQIGTHTCREIFLFLSYLFPCFLLSAHFPSR